MSSLFIETMVIIRKRGLNAADVTDRIGFVSSLAETLLQNEVAEMTPQTIGSVLLAPEMREVRNGEQLFMKIWASGCKTVPDGIRALVAYCIADISHQMLTGINPNIPPYNQDPSTAYAADGL